ncbi:restriction endonuclease subunit S [Gelidibacter japonicus]|uniref:restriction endonuclease subunit S n=1 Tax=Gelidibacter japonicus TaxID=1962232 RepID=UPI0019633552|nr:restriction endonuclease subunit S [Gelidibacter japonicus]
MISEQISIDKSDWTPVKFGDIVFEPKESSKDPKADGIKHVVGLEHIESEDIHLRHSANLDTSTTFSKRFAAGDVLFGRRRAYLKKAAQAKFSGICSGDITVLRAKDNLIPELLPFIVQNDKFFDYAIKHSAGGLSPRVKFKDQANYKFLLPPKDQQAKLAELLWAMDEVIEGENNVLENLETFKLSFIKSEIFEKSIEENYVIVSIGELFDIKTGSKNAQDSIEKGQYPFFTRSIETQRIDTFDYDQEALILPGEGNFQIKYFKGKFNVHQRTYILSNKNKFNINLKLYRDIIQDKVAELIQKSVGSTVNSLRKPIIEQIKIPLIEPSEQSYLLKKCELQDFNIEQAKSKISSSKALQKSLINQVF